MQQIRKKKSLGTFIAPRMLFKIIARILTFQAACMFYPTSNAFSFNPVPNLEVKFASKSSSPHYDIYNITATNTLQQVCS